MGEAKTPKVFISYAWQNSDRVLELAERLMQNGVDVILDKWDLKEGHDKYAFMEQSVNNAEVDKVLIICDKFYTEKANAREGGVGDETVIISPELYGNVAQEKFIPIIFEVDENAKPYCPAYIRSRIYIDLSTEDDRYEANYETLLRNIHNKPLYRKPSLGTTPEWLECESVDLSSIRDMVKQIRGYTGGNKTKADFLVRKCTDEFIIAFKSLAPKEGLPHDEALLVLIEKGKIVRDLYVDYLEAVIYCDLPVGTIIPIVIEQSYNSTHDASGMSTCANNMFEFYDFSVWELLICTVAVLLHFERFAELHQVLTHTYFLRESCFSTRMKDYSYTQLYAYCQTIENICKPKCPNPRLHTLTGDMLIRREKKLILTKETLSNADIVLYQLFPVYDLGVEGHDYWFPLSYKYCSTNQSLWYKMKSKAYCEKIMPLFGITTVSQLKEMVQKGKSDQGMRHRGVFEVAPTIMDCIKQDDIAVLN